MILSRKYSFRPVYCVYWGQGGRRLTKLWGVGGYLHWTSSTPSQQSSNMHSCLLLATES